MWSAGEKEEQKEQEGEEVIVTKESGKGRVRGEEIRRKKRTEHGPFTIIKCFQTGTVAGKERRGKR